MGTQFLGDFNFHLVLVLFEDILPFLLDSMFFDVGISISSTHKVKHNPTS